VIVGVASTEFEDKFFVFTFIVIAVTHCGIQEGRPQGIWDSLILP